MVCFPTGNFSSYQDKGEQYPYGFFLFCVCCQSIVKQSEIDSNCLMINTQKTRERGGTSQTRRERLEKDIVCGPDNACVLIRRQSSQRAFPN